MSPGERTPRAGNAAEAAFLTIGDGAAVWLVEAAAAGAPGCGRRWPRRSRSPSCTARAVVDQALQTAALAGRFAEHDLAAILDHQQAGPTSDRSRASETHSLQPGTRAWASFGTRAGGGHR